jgi:hypothetical protein
MNDKVMRMAIECQLINTSNRTGIYAGALHKFADLIRADEREVIADLLEHGYTDDEGHHIQYAEEIRARSNK